MQRRQRESAQTPPSTSGSSEQRLLILDVCVSATHMKAFETHNIGRCCRCTSAKVRQQQRLDGLRNLKSYSGTLVTDEFRVQLTTSAGVVDAILPNSSSTSGLLGSSASVARMWPSHHSGTNDTSARRNNLSQAISHKHRERQNVVFRPKGPVWPATPSPCQIAAFAQSKQQPLPAAAARYELHRGCLFSRRIHMWQRIKIRYHIILKTQENFIKFSTQFQKENAKNIYTKARNFQTVFITLLVFLFGKRNQVRGVQRLRFGTRAQ